MVGMLHALLLRQLRRLGLSPEQPPPPEAWRALLERVSRAYQDADKDRYLLERSQELSSREMVALYEQLRQERDLLESRVEERTEALRLSEARLSSLVSLSSDWIWEQDAQLRMTYMSDGARSKTGIDGRAALGLRREDLPGFEADSEAMELYQACIAAREPFRDFTFGMRAPDGSTRYIRTSGFPLFDGEGRFAGYRGVGADVTEATLAARQVERLAHYDSLTGLVNRATFVEELERAAGRRPERPFALCFIDLDGFKPVNDTMGHAAGDELLRQMSRRLRAAVRETDTVGRLGGDEFVVLLDGTSDLEAMRRIGEKLLSTIREPARILGRDVQVTGSIGMARFPSDALDPAVLLQQADAAMYRAKESGKNELFVHSDASARAAL